MADLSGHRLDIASNRKALIDGLPRFQSLHHLHLRHACLILESESEARNQHGNEESTGTNLHHGSQHHHVPHTRHPGTLSSGLMGPQELVGAVANVSSLRELDLSGNCVGTQGAALLAKCLPSLSNLSHLSLRGADLDDTSVFFLSKLSCMGNLARLDVSQNNFSYFGCTLLKSAGLHLVVFDPDLAWIREVL